MLLQQLFAAGSVIMHGEYSPITRRPLRRMIFNYEITIISSPAHMHCLINCLNTDPRNLYTPHIICSLRFAVAFDLSVARVPVE